MNPEGTELAQRDESQFLELEKRDEAQILSELQGLVLKEMFYVSKEGKAVVSWIGIKEIARKYGGIDVNLIDKTDLGDQWFVCVKATDKKNGYSMLGASTQAKQMDIYDRDASGKRLDTTHKESDPFVLQKAFSKSQRNAIRALVPETFFAQMIDTWRKGVPPPPRKPAPPSTQSPTAYGNLPPKKVDAIATVKDEPKKEEPAPAFQSAAELSTVPDDFRPCEEAGYAIDYIVENYEQQPEIIRALVYKAMTAVEPHLTDVEAVKAVREEFEERRKPAEPTGGSESDVVYNALIDQALTGDMIVVVSPGVLMTRKKPNSEKREFLGDRFFDYSDVLRDLGYEWVKAGAESHWAKAKGEPREAQP